MRKKLVRFFGSIKLTVALLFLLFFLILLATFAQVDLGIFEANKKYFTSWFVWFHSTTISIPIFLGGFSIGLLLVINLITSHVTNFRFKKNYSGIFLIHFGLILIIVGSALTSWFGHEMQIAVEENNSKNYVDFPTDFEFVLIDTSNSEKDIILSESVKKIATTQFMEGLTITLNHYFPNAYVNQRGIINKKYNEFGHDFKLIPLPKTYKMDEKNIPGLDLSFMYNGVDIGRFILWGGMEIYQELIINNISYLISVRPKRLYLPFTIQLDDFRKENYELSSVVESYESDVTVANQHGEFTTTISMNTPLRFKGFTFFQASFSEDEVTSVFQVVKNPSWLIPYISSFLIVFGLFVQMLQSMKRSKA